MSLPFSTWLRITSTVSSHFDDTSHDAVSLSDIFFIGKCASITSFPLKEITLETMDMATLLPSSLPLGKQSTGTSVSIFTAFTVIRSGAPGPMPIT
jgi:hypothetical protein